MLKAKFFIFLLFLKEFFRLSIWLYNTKEFEVKQNELIISGSIKIKFNHLTFFYFFLTAFFFQINSEKQFVKYLSLTITLKTDKDCINTKFQNPAFNLGNIIFWLHDVNFSPIYLVKGSFRRSVWWYLLLESLTGANLYLYIYILLYWFCLWSYAHRYIM